MYNDYDTKQTNLLHNNITDDISKIDKKLESLSEDLNDLKDYSEQLSDKGYVYYSENTNNMHEIITESEDLIQEIEDGIEQINQYDLAQLNNKQKILDLITKFSNKVKGFKRDLNQLTKDIHSSESRFQGQTSKERDMNNDFKPGDFDGNKIQLVAELNSNTDKVNQRRKDLEKIKITSAQLNDLSSQLKVDVYKQGEALTSIEDNILQVNQDAFKADEEIKKADEYDKKAHTKTIWIIVIIAFIVISASVLAYLIYTNVS